MTSGPCWRRITDRTWPGVVVSDRAHSILWSNILGQQFSAAETTPLFLYITLYTPLFILHAHGLDIEDHGLVRAAHGAGYADHLSDDLRCMTCWF